MQEDQYANWMAAFRLACKGRTMADSSYASEVKSIASLLSIQHRATPTHNATTNSLQSGAFLNVQPLDFIPGRFLKKFRSKQVNPWSFFSRVLFKLNCVLYFPNVIFSFLIFFFEKAVVQPRVQYAKGSKYILPLR